MKDGQVMGYVLPKCRHKIFIVWLFPPQGFVKSPQKFHYYIG